MGISFKPLWKLLLNRNMKKTDLKAAANISSPTLAKLSKNRPVDSRTIEKLCAALSCQPGEIMEYAPAEKTANPPPGQNALRRPFLHKVPEGKGSHCQ
jgi:DNA-binding Xre family transcriptional regulator